MADLAACILFTDLVGSTELLSGLGEAAFDELRRAHFAALRSAIERAGGAEVKTLGDGVLATFPSAAGGVEAAVAIQQVTDRQARTGPARLAVRIGLSMGDVSVEDGDVFGAPVVEAARLVEAAGPGQILATTVVRVVAGARTAARFTDAGLRSLKGLPEPLPTCEVAWEPLPAAGVPLPGFLAHRGRVFVGRERELELLRRLWKEAQTGEGRLALVGGEPGIGKTRLTAELAEAAHAEGAVVLGGQCDEDLGVPYQPFVEALRQYVTHAPDLRLGRYPGELVRLVPEIAERVSGLPELLHSDPETERYRLFDAVASWLGAVAGEAPVLVVLDDLQWAAKPTLLMLRHALRPADPMRLLVLVTYRDTEVGRDHPVGELFADLRRRTGVERLSISGLDRSGVAAFLEQAAGHDLDDEGEALAGAIHDETDGNPFFVGEVLRHLAETGALVRDDARWSTGLSVDELGIPEGVKDVVGRRLSRLSRSANEVLAWAAAVGLEFELSILAAASALESDALLAGLDESVAARLVGELSGSRYRFAHALVRDTLYDELSAARRVLVHRRVAEAIETVHGQHLDDHLPALAHHFSRAAAPAADAGKAIAYSARAGDRALAQLAHDEAATYYGQALELLDVADGPVDEAQRLGLLLALGEAQRRAGNPAYRETLLAAAGRARARGDAEALSQAALANSRGTVYANIGEVDAERVAVLEEALAAVDAGSPSRPRLLATLGLELTWGDRTRRVQLSDEALVLARRLGDPATLAEVLVSRYYAIVGPATHGERQANTAELLALATRLGDSALISRALAVRFRVAVEAGDMGEADRCLEANERLTDDLHQPTLRWFAALQRAGRSLFCGRLEEAERLIEEAWRVGERAGQPDAPVLFLWQRFNLALERGRLGEIVDELDNYVRPAVSGRPRMPAEWALLALARVELDQPEAAREAFGMLADSGFADLPVDTIWLRGATDFAATCAQLGDVAAAEALSTQLAPYGHLYPTACLGTPTGCVSHSLGLLATTLERYDEAGRHFAAAEAGHAHVGAPTWLARTRLEWARMLLCRRADGDAERARELLAAALATARELGLGSIERQGAALAGGGPAR
jgi:class 3 adenylate cyclase